MEARVVTFDATAANGETLEKLGEVIAWRAKALNTNCREATIATVVTALKSIRAATRVSKGKLGKVFAAPRERLSVTVEKVANLTPCFNKKKKKWGIVNGAKHFVDIAPWWQVPPNSNDRKFASVYRIALSSDRIEAWPHQRKESYLVAADDASAKRIVEKRFGGIVQKNRSIAKTALSRAMMLVSDRSVAVDAGRGAMNVAFRHALVRKDLQGFDSGRFEIEVEDSLRYATDALKGGEAVVNQSLMKAANSVVGYVNNQIEKQKAKYFQSFAETRESPFPPEMFSP